MKKEENNNNVNLIENNNNKKKIKIKIKSKNKYMLYTMMLIIVSLVICISNFNISKASEEVIVTAEHECPILLKKGSIRIGTAFTTANINGVNYPAYCLDVNKKGVDENLKSYKVKVGETIDNQGVYKAIINGYPYVSLKELGVETKEEAFTATKQAVYTMLYNRNISEYSAINSIEGKRTYEAYKKIVEKARNSKEKYDQGTIKIEELSDWEVIDNKYLRKKVIVKSNKKGDVKINLESDLKTLKLTDLNGDVKDSFKCDEQMYLIVGIQELRNNGKIVINAKGSLVTNPILFSKPEKNENQEYAISGMKVRGNVETKKEILYEKNNTRIRLIKIDGESKEPLDEVEFKILDENKKEIGTYTTDINGEIIFEDLVPGKYYLLETKSKVGYLKADEPVEIDVSYNEDITIKVDNTKIPKIEKTPKEKRIEIKRLPRTGY